MLKIFVGNLPSACSDEELSTFFASLQSIEVLDAFVVKDKVTKKAKQFGFVEIAGDPDIASIQEIFRGQSLRGRELRIDFATPK